MDVVVCKTQIPRFSTPEVCPCLGSSKGKAHVRSRSGKENQGLDWEALCVGRVALMLLLWEVGVWGRRALCGTGRRRRPGASVAVRINPDRQLGSTAKDSSLGGRLPFDMPDLR